MFAVWFHLLLSLHCHLFHVHLTSTASFIDMFMEGFHVLRAHKSDTYGSLDVTYDLAFRLCVFLVYAYSFRR